MSKRTIAAAIGAALLGGVAFSTQSSAATFTAFGPKDYNRSTGKPAVATDGFSVLNPGSFYVLHVYNGGKSGQFPGRASSAVIGLNGVEVVGPAAFNQQLWHIERAVELLPNNQLTVEMRSKPGSGMTIEIIGIDNDPPTIVAVVSPPPNAAGWNNSNVTVSFEGGDAHSGIAFCFSSPVVISPLTVDNYRKVQEPCSTRVVLDDVLPQNLPVRGFLTPFVFRIVSKT